MRGVSSHTDQGRTLLPETVKHYLETIFYIEHEGERVRPGRIAEWMGLTAPTVSVTLRRLGESGWIEVAKDRTVKLTPKGEELAAGVVRVHRLLERWLTDVLGFDWAAADEHAQAIAPSISEAVAARLDEHLGHPTTCPHGNVIPGRTVPYGTLRALSDLSPGASGRVCRISEVAEHDAPELLQQLDRLGVVTGVDLKVTAGGKDSGAITVEVGGHDAAIGTSMARFIWIAEASPAA
jgi:DtxR family transcriptional regulator, Mn-dependent transcriptional regulator